MKNIYLIAALMIAFGVTGCQTIQGVGKDLTNAGEAVERATQ